MGAGECLDDLRVVVHEGVESHSRVWELANRGMRSDNLVQPKVLLCHQVGGASLTSDNYCTTATAKSVDLWTTRSRIQTDSIMENNWL